tara:strand:+ start:15653 stop:16468 length:816 start_codon:yes stop_codon:yes gene_type:complete
MAKFDKIIYYRSKDGQQKEGVNKTPDNIDFLINKNIIRYNVPIIDHLSPMNNLYNNLYNLYNYNTKIIGPRINFGGDHSMAIASLAYSLNEFKNLKVIWIDAHADINTLNDSVSKNYHGMPLSFLTGLDKDNKFSFIKNLLDFDNLLYIGIRDLDNFEKEIIVSKKIKYISVEEFNNNNEKSLQFIKNFIKNSNIHISFDVDSMDPSLIQCTGTSVKNGLFLEPVKKLFNMLINADNIVNFDITELNLEEGFWREKINSLQNLFYLLEFMV